MKKYLFFPLILVFFNACTTKKKDNTQNKIFNQLNEIDTGISFINTLTENDSLNYFTYGYIYMGGGVSAGDINNDGLIDLYFSGNMVQNKLYLNKGNLKFEDITETAAVSGDSRWYTGVTMADVNADGLLDIYCSVGGKFGLKENQLFINNGDLTFSEKAKEFGLNDGNNGVQSTFFDYDLDGDLDVYIANYPPSPFNAPNQHYLLKKKFTKDEETDKLLRNDGDFFTDVTQEAGMKTFGLSLSATVGDLNQDGWPDLYVSNDFSTPDLFYLNNKDGTFTESVRKLTKNTAFYGMGVDIADFNNDQLLDIFQVDMTAEDNRRSKANMASMNPKLFWGTVNAGFHYQYMQNSLQLNNGNINDSLPDFSNISRLAGISSTDWSWGPLIADLDNDGWKDIFIANGTRREINNKDYFKHLENSKHRQDSLLEKSLAMPSERIDNYAYKNNGDLTFTKMNQDWGISFKGFSNGSVYVDLDNDGDLEIITNNIDDLASVFENTSSLQNNHITLRFNGPEKNPSGVGVKVYLKTSSGAQFQELTLTRGFQSSVAPQLHFGLGKTQKIDTLDIKWPDGNAQVLTNIDVNQILAIKHADASLIKEKPKLEPDNLFSTVKDSILDHLHVENRYDDFVKEVLIPHKTSMLGPFVAVSDLNGDTLDDIVVGGAAFQEAAIYLQTPVGFNKVNGEVFTGDKMYEDMGIHIFDADNDADNDIYIVSGGNEFEPNTALLQDRLYINNGEGEFTKSTDALPKMYTSGSRVKSFDFDKDGDLDLFVGGRLVPGNYPSPANSYILENRSENGSAHFVDVTKELAPMLLNLGMVTDATWTDFDKDGWTDLIIVGEWMPITILRNNKGNFDNVTENYDLADSNGWWFSIEEGDFDKDGDIDFIIGNLGLNYKYKAAEDQTFDIYFNDFDEN
ncbi:MAG: VCBS repeat-containing protein, partial [Maribacter sp.]